MSAIDSAGIRKRLRSHLIGKSAQFGDDTELARELGSTGLFDRGNATKMLRGDRQVSRGFLDAIESMSGFRSRYYIETGEWPDDETQAEQIAKLSKEEFNALIDLASNPKLRALAAKLKTTSPENLAILERLLNENVSFANMFMLALERATTAKDNEAELARLKKISSDIKKGLKKK